MNIKKIALNCFLAAALAACSSSGGDGGGTTDGGKTDTAGGGTDTAGGGTDTAGGGTDAPKTDAPKTDAPKTDTTPSGDDACGAMGTNADCQKCCGSTNHPAAFDAFVKALTTCGCKAGNCDTDCKDSVCASPPAALTATCNTCLNKIQGTACKTDLQTCSTTGPCKDFYDCVVAQDCNSKG